MTAIQKTVFTLVCCAAIAIANKEAFKASRARSEIELLKQQQSSLHDRIRRLQNEIDDAKRNLSASHDENGRLNQNNSELLKLRGEAGVLRNATGLGPQTPMESEIKSSMVKVDKLKQFLARNPKANIPELEYVKEGIWFANTSGNLESETDYLRAAARMELHGVTAFLSEVEIALKGYSAANGNQFPTDVLQLKPYFKSPVNDATLQRYGIFPSKMFSERRRFPDWIIAQNTRYTNIVGNEIRMGVGLLPNGESEMVEVEQARIVSPHY